MGNGSSSSSSLTISAPNPYITTISPSRSKLLSSSAFFPTTISINTNFLLKKPRTMTSSNSTVKSGGGGGVEIKETPDEKNPIFETLNSSPDLLQNLIYDALVWSSLHGLVVGHKSVQKSGTVPGVGMVHAPFALLPMSFPESHWEQACELAPIFNELVDRVSLDGKFLQDSLSRTRKVDAFTSRLLDIHSKMLELNKNEEIRLGLHRSDYMLDAQTKELLQIELNTISSSFAGLSCLVSDLHRNLLNHYGELLGLDSKRVPANGAANQFAEALALAWKEYNNPRAVVVIVVQPEETNMYDQHWLSFALKEKYPFTIQVILYALNARIILKMKKQTVKFNP
ncbi:hypothetical protein MKW94_016734 [Papaver nudicaule]|uniref:Glutathione synthase substrate-binding domain-containing protein n=1 Tax=Papaver nudicaule TaxID=74823 RepID=A0AA41W212_PAPNU|nr:hypothetical protein [Papaver nudicaule]